MVWFGGYSSLREPTLARILPEQITYLVQLICPGDWDVEVHAAADSSRLSACPRIYIYIYANIALLLFFPPN